MLDSELKKRLFKELMLRHVIVAKNQFMYVSGYSGFDFFDSDYLSLSPETSELVASIYSDSIKKFRESGTKVTKLVFLEKSGGTVGPISLTAMIGKKTGLDTVVIRRRVPCSCSMCRSELRLKGSSINPLSSNDTLVIVEDVATTGSTIEEAANIVEASGAKVVGAIVLLDREMGARSRLKKMNIELYSVLERTALIELGFIPPTVEDVSSRDFTHDLGKILSVSGQELSNIQENLDSFVSKILESKGRDVTEENKRVMRNLLLAFSFGLRTKAPYIENIEQQK